MTELIQLLGCESVGMPISVSLNLQFENRISAEACYFLREVRNKLRRQGYCLATLPLLGYHREGQIVNVDGSSETEFHEEVHRWLYEEAGDHDASFSEAVAHGLTIYQFENKSTQEQIQRELAGLSSFHLAAARALTNGGLERKPGQMQRYIQTAGLEGMGNNWVLFLDLVENFRYLPMVLNVLNNSGRDTGEEIILDTAQLISSSGLITGLEYLSCFVDFNFDGEEGACFVDRWREFDSPKNGAYPINDLEVCVCGFDDDEALTLQAIDDEESFSIRLRTFDPRVKQIVDTAFRKGLDKFEMALDSEILLFTYPGSAICNS